MIKKIHWKRFLAWVLLVASVCMMIRAGYGLWNIHRMYAEGNQNYEELALAVKRSAGSKPAPPDLTELTDPKETEVSIPQIDIDFEKLQAINPDAVAWLYCPDTVIDYPVMRSDDYNRYLHHLPDGTYNANGSLFLDYNNPSDFSGRLNIIYGHHMRSKRMFGSLDQYKKQTYYETHPYMYLYTVQKNYRVDLLYGCVIGAGQWRERAFMYESNRDGLLDYAAHHTTFESNTSYTEEDRIVVLSTCSYEFDDARYIVIGVLKSG